MYTENETFNFSVPLILCCSKDLSGLFEKPCVLEKETMIWLAVVTLLYSEIALVMLILLPLISSSKWKQLWESRFVRYLTKRSALYFRMLVVGLAVMFFSAINDIKKRTEAVEAIKHDSQAELESKLFAQTKMFFAQRNFYISGFALFLWLVLRRLLTLIYIQAGLEERLAAIPKIVPEDENKNEKNDVRKAPMDDVEYEKKIALLKDQLNKKDEELDQIKFDLQSTKEQSESVEREYEKLRNINKQLENDLMSTQEVVTDKKDD